tara:strand:- start:5837 stop:6196 length:360 start_codon:yes stop_codon:yes gene_type:complete
MRKVISILFLFLIASSVQAHEDPLQIPWPKGEKVPCRCDILAMDYELCLKGIGREDCFKPVAKKELQCSPYIAPGSVVLTNPPTYNCEDLKKKTALETRLKQLEKRIKELEKVLDSKSS